MRSLTIITLVLAACQTSTEPAPQMLNGALALELRDVADVSIEVVEGSRDGAISLRMSEGYGFVENGTEFRGSARIEPFPEAGGTQYSATFSAPARPGGPCGESPISMAFSVYRQGNNASVLGGVSVYCADQKWHGVPKRVLRLAGTLQ